MNKMKLPNRIDLLRTQQQANALGGRVSKTDLAISKPILKNRMPVIQLEVGGNPKNHRGSIKHINRLSNHYFS